MRRREFITLLGGGAAAVIWPLASPAQQFETITRVGVLVMPSAPHPFTEAFQSGLRDLGYSEGRNTTIEWRYADASFSRAVELAEELVRLQVDVIAALHTPAGDECNKNDPDRDVACRRTARNGANREPGSPRRERDGTVRHGGGASRQ